MEIPYFEDLLEKPYCLQACMRMVLKYYFPERDYSFEEINRMIGIESRLIWLSAMEAVVIFDDLGLDATCYSTMDSEEYIDKGEQYVKENYDDWENILGHIDVEIELKFTRTALERGLSKRKELTFKDVEKFFGKNYILIILLNVNELKGKEGYLGHFVVLTDITDEYVQFHDPTEGPDRKVPREDFIRAWYDDDTDRGALVVYGLKEQ